MKYEPFHGHANGYRHVNSEIKFLLTIFFHFTIGAFQTDLTLFNQRGGNRHLNLQKKLNVEEFFRYHFPLL